MKWNKNIAQTIVFFVFVTILFFNDAKNVSELRHQHEFIVIMEKRISQLETNNVKMMEAWTKWANETRQFNDEMMKNVKKADDILDQKIEYIKSFDAIVVERLKSISEAQNSVINTLIGISSTNLVDKAK